MPVFGCLDGHRSSFILVFTALPLSVSAARPHHAEPRPLVNCRRRRQLRTSVIGVAWLAILVTGLDFVEFWIKYAEADLYDQKVRRKSAINPKFKGHSFKGKAINSRSGYFGLSLQELTVTTLSLVHG